jgi:hypothetical protein
MAQRGAAMTPSPYAEALPDWVLWGFLVGFGLLALCALVADIQRKRERWQQVLGVRMQEACNDDEAG